jgi:hypothetical protein
MTPAEIAAYIGAAAWLPIVIGWLYKVFVKPKVTIIPAEFPEIGFSTLGPILNVRMAITAARKTAIIDSIDLLLSHQDGDSRKFHWSGMTEQVSQIVDDVGAARQRIQKETDPIAFVVGTESVSVKYVRFQDPSFHEEMQPAVDALVEKAHFLKKQNQFFHAEILRSQEFDNVKRGWARQFPWKTGKYIVTFSVSSPHRLKLEQIKLEFELNDTDIEILKQNFAVNENYHRAIFRQFEDGTPQPTLQWNWRFPKAKKLRE